MPGVTRTRQRPTGCLERPRPDGGPDMIERKGCEHDHNGAIGGSQPPVHKASAKLDSYQFRWPSHTVDARKANPNQNNEEATQKRNVPPELRSAIVNLKSAENLESVLSFLSFGSTSCQSVEPYHS